MTEESIPIEEMDEHVTKGSEIEASGSTGSESASWMDELTVRGEEVVETVMDLVKEANVRRVVVKRKDGRVILELPVYAGVAGLLLIGPWAAVPLALALATDCSILVERREPPDTEDIPVAAEDPDRTTTPDNLTKIRGIGPKVAGLLQRKGIKTYAQLAATKVSKLQEILDAAGPRYQSMDPTTWPAQAQSFI